MVKWPNTIRSQAVLLATVAVIVFGWPKYTTYLAIEKEGREDIRIKREMARAAWIDDALKGKARYMEWKKLELDRL